MKGLKFLYMVPFMLVMAVVLTFLPNTTLSTIGEYWAIIIVPYAFVVSGLVLKNWFDEERAYRTASSPISRDVLSEPEVEIMCKKCRRQEAVTPDGYCERCNRETLEVTTL